ncbi:MAG: hypothetical protein V1709_04995, partial [Planctomycetota bacterium]
LHWGTGSAMTSVEMMVDQLGDAYIDLNCKHGVGFNACTIDNVKVDGTNISFDITTADVWMVRQAHHSIYPERSRGTEPILVRFEGVNTNQTYHIVVNGKDMGEVNGNEMRGVKLKAEEINRK